MTCSPKWNNPYGFASHCVKYDHKLTIEGFNSEKSFLTAVRRRRYDMRGVENDIGVEKVKAVLFKVGKSFPFAHS
jgi:hypothetical protein